MDSCDKMDYFKHFYSWAETACSICNNIIINWLIGKREEFKDVRFDLIKPEIDNLISLINGEEYEVVFGHHDLQHGNILMNNEGKIMFVDFEYMFLQVFTIDMLALYLLV